MSQGSAVHAVVYDQQVYDQSRVPAEQHQSCIHHSWNSAVQSMRICHPSSENLGLASRKLYTSKWQVEVGYYASKVT